MCMSIVTIEFLFIGTNSEGIVLNFDHKFALTNIYHMQFAFLTFHLQDWKL